MSDPMNTTRFDGAACVSCGDDAVWCPVVAEGSQLTDTPLCGKCADDEITKCPGCESFIWCKDGTRIGTELYCAGCAAKHPVIVGATMAEILADEQQDAFNQVRR